MAAWLKIGLGLGAGVLVGAAAICLLSRKSPTVRKGLVTALSYGIDAKDKAKSVVSGAKEELQDFVEEAKTANKSRAKA